MRRTLRKITALLTCAVLAASLSACGEITGLDAQALMSPPRTTADRQAIYTLMCGEESDVTLIYPKNGIVAHANHIVSNPEFDTSHGKKFRGERLWALLEAKRGDITLDYIKECLRDHQGYPESVCSHPHSGTGSTDPYKMWQTVASLIYDLDSLTMDLCCCNPCENEYSQIRLADIK